MVKGIVGGDEFFTEVIIRGLTLNAAADGYYFGNFNENVGRRIANKYGVHFVKNIDDFVGNSALLFLTFEITEAEKMLQRLAEKVNPETLIVSAVSDLNLKKLEETFPNNEIIRLFITPSIISGQGLGAYVVSKNASISAQSVAEIILKDCGDVINVENEAELEKIADYLTANTYVSYVTIQGMLKSAKKLGLTEMEANFVVSKLFGGSVYTLIENGKDTAAMIRRGTLDQKFRTKVTKLIETQGIKAELEKFIERPVYAEIIEAEEAEKLEHGGTSSSNRFSNTQPAAAPTKTQPAATEIKTPKLQMHYRG